MINNELSQRATITDLETRLAAKADSNHLHDNDYFRKNKSLFKVYQYDKIINSGENGRIRIYDYNKIYPCILYSWLQQTNSTNNIRIVAYLHNNGSFLNYIQDSEKFFFNSTDGYSYINYNINNGNSYKLWLSFL